MTLPFFYDDDDFDQLKWYGLAMIIWLVLIALMIAAIVFGGRDGTQKANENVPLQRDEGSKGTSK